MIPDIPGLAEAKAKWPIKIIHSKSFRNAEGLEGKVFVEPIVKSRALPDLIANFPTRMCF